VASISRPLPGLPDYRDQPVILLDDPLRLDANSSKLSSRPRRKRSKLRTWGRVAVPVPIWEKAGPLTAGEWERVRLHPYFTERVLSRSPFLAALAPVATAARRLGLPPRCSRRLAHFRCAAARGRRCLPGDDRATAAPRGDPTPARRGGDRGGGPGRAARWRGGGRRAGSGGAAVSADRASSGSDRARGRGRGPAGARSADQAGGACARHLGQDRRPPRPGTRTGRSASRRGPRSRCSRWSTGSRYGENSRLAAAPAARSVLVRPRIAKRRR
jgi:hypothetical protein